MNEQTGCEQQLRRGIWSASVLRHVPVCPDHFKTGLTLPPEFGCRPGQFVQLQCGPSAQVDDPVMPVVHQRFGPSAAKCVHPECGERTALLRRPFSVAGLKKRFDQVEVDLVYRVIGPGTRWLASRGSGTALRVIGPLGNGFRLDQERSAAVLVGGGVGLAPLMLLGEHLVKSGKRCVAVAGAKTAGQLPLTLTQRPSRQGVPTRCVAEFADHGIPVVVASDDGSIGLRGLATTGMEEVLGRGDFDPGDTVVYTCGPEAMMQAVAGLAEGAGTPCQVCLERVMGCGMGTCQSCIVRVRDGGAAAGWRFKLCCTDGPVFDSTELLW